MPHKIRVIVYLWTWNTS